MTRMSTTTIAMMSRTWMKPPIVYDVTIPSNHRTRRITKMVQSISYLHLKECASFIREKLLLRPDRGLAIPVLFPFFRRSKRDAVDEGGTGGGTGTALPILSELTLAVPHPQRDARNGRPFFRFRGAEGAGPCRLSADPLRRS